MRKIYYFPGLISAIIIPILFWYYGNRKFEEINLNVIDIAIPAKVRPGDNINNIYTFESARNWNYKKIKVNSGKAKENSNLYVSEMKKLQKRNQQRSGIEFILDNNNTYGDFVSLLNDMHITKSEEYAVDLEKTGHLFVIQNYFLSITKDNFFGKDYTEIPMGNDTINNWEAYLKFIEPKGYDRFTQILTQLPKQAFLIIFGFLFLLHISMLSIKERFQFQRSHYY